MEITEVRVRLLSNPDSRVKAFCSITLDNVFVVREVKVISGDNGLYVAMPDRKMTDHCPRCRANNPVSALFCSDCGAKLPYRPAPMEYGTRNLIYADFAHPINSQCRDMIKQKVLEAYETELSRSAGPAVIAAPVAESRVEA